MVGISLRRGVLVVAFATALAAIVPARAEKEGMPDLVQIDNTCLPTSAANLLIWFGRHGYPNLVVAGRTEDERETRSVYRLMADTQARYDLGTRMTEAAAGIEKYIHEAGYHASVEYRGLEGREPLTHQWLAENDNPNRGYILILNYCRYDRSRNTFYLAFGTGHAVTLVGIHDDTLLVHDPGHDEDETGRKIVTARTVGDGSWTDSGGTSPLAGMMLLSGSLLEAPPETQVMLIGAIGITMHPASDERDSSLPLIGASAKTLSSARPPETPGAQSWSSRFYHYFFRR